MGYFLAGFIIAWFMCHSYTHHMIAAECKRLGGFFVGDTTYKCIAVENTTTSNKENNL